MKHKKTIISIIAICALTITGVVIFYFTQNSTNWKSLSEIKQYSKIFDQPITQITLRKTIDSAEWVVFNDDDLINQWTEFLKTTEIKREKRLSKSNAVTGGGAMVAVIQTGTTEFTMYIIDDNGNYKLQVDDYLYTVKSEVTVPFIKTYDIAAERHGLTSPWD